MGDEPKKPQSWWQTVPGVLSGLAALIAALTGLYGAHHQFQNQQSTTKPSTDPPSPSLTQSSPNSPSSPIVSSPPILPSPTPPPVTPSPKPTTIDLSGTWIAEGYTCPANVAIPLEEIEIKHDGNYFVATKIKGDDCIRSGEITFQGSYDGMIPVTIPVKINTGSPNTTSRQLVDALLEVKTSNKFEVVFSGAKMEFSRKK